MMKMIWIIWTIQCGGNCCISQLGARECPWKVSQPCVAMGESAGLTSHVPINQWMNSRCALPAQSCICGTLDDVTYVLPWYV